MTATHAAERGLGEIRLSLVTPERQPLELFGAQASQTVRELLNERGIELHASRYPVRFEDGQLSLIPNGTLAAERVVSLPSLLGPQLEGLPADPDGFIPVDLHGLVQGEEDVYAAGDATNSPIKQGGVASQQADAAAEAIRRAPAQPWTRSRFGPCCAGCS